jgi:AAA family ATPase
MRPGRLDRILFVGPPDKKGREEILKIRTKIMTVGPDVDIENIAGIVSLLHSTSIHFHWFIREQTDGCSGAEITSLCQEAAILTMQNNMSALYVSPIFILRRS